MQIRLRQVALSLILLSISSFAAPGQSAPLKVSEIRIYGNKITNDQLILAYLGVDTGDVFDSVSTIDAQKSLHKTGLFASVRVFSQAVTRGIRLLVIVEERLYLSINDIGGELYNRLYGEDRDWWKARFGLTFDNFRGRMEKLSAHLTFWTSRSLSLSWHKPFLGTPYFLKTGVTLSLKPYTYDPYNRFTLQQFTTFGRKFGKHSMIYASLMPGMYKDYEAEQDDAHARQGAANKIGTDPFYELFFSLGFTNDLRDHSFNTHTGSLFHTSILTNYPYSGDSAYSYVQLNTENRVFHRGFRPDHTAAYRLRTILRKDSAGLYNHLYAGGENTIRGYGSNAVGTGVGANNRVLFSAEYRIPLFKTPTVDLPVVDRFDNRMKNFHYQVDGALIFDYGYLWRDLTDPHRKSAFQKDGAGAGIGLRVLAPTLQRAVSFDIVWPLIGYNKSKKWVPAWHLYVDLPY